MMQYNELLLDVALPVVWTLGYCSHRPTHRYASIVLVQNIQCLSASCTPRIQFGRYRWSCIDLVVRLRRSGGGVGEVVVHLVVQVDVVGGGDGSPVQAHRQGDVVAVVVVGLHAQEAGHGLSSVDGQWLLEHEATLVPVGAWGERSGGQLDGGLRAVEVHVKPACDTVQQSCGKASKERHDTHQNGWGTWGRLT